MNRWVLSKQHRQNQECGFSVISSSGDNVHVCQIGSDLCSGIESGIIVQSTLAGFFYYVFQQQGVNNHFHKAVSTALLQMT